MLENKDEAKEFLENYLFKKYEGKHINSMQRLFKHQMSLEPIRYCEDWAMHAAYTLLDEEDTLKDNVGKIFLKDKTNRQELQDTTYVILSELGKDELRILKVDESILQLLDATDSDYKYRPPAYDLFFINENIDFGEFILKGVFVYNTQSNLMNGSLQKISENPDFFICGVAAKKDGGEERFFKFNLIEFSTKKIKKESIGFMKDIRHAVSRIVINLIDLINNNGEDITIHKIVPPLKRIEKKKKRGEYVPRETIVIRPTKKLYKYITTFRADATTYGFKFMVRGHYMHFQSERYKEARGTSVWVKPFYKGEGVIKNKIIEVKA